MQIDELAKTELGVELDRRKTKDAMIKRLYVGSKEMKDKVVGITFSTFDLLHAGHIGMLREAKDN